MNFYQKVLKVGKAVIDELQVPIKVKEQKKKLELKILELEEKALTTSIKVEELKAAYPVDWDKLVDAIDSDALTQRKLKILRELEHSMFVEEVKE